MLEGCEYLSCARTEESGRPFKQETTQTSAVVQPSLYVPHPVALKCAKKILMSTSLAATKANAMSKNTHRDKSSSSRVHIVSFRRPGGGLSVKTVYCVFPFILYAHPQNGSFGRRQDKRFQAQSRRFTMRLPCGLTPPHSLTAFHTPALDEHDSIRRTFRPFFARTLPHDASIYFIFINRNGSNQIINISTYQHT